MTKHQELAVKVGCRTAADIKEARERLDMTEFFNEQLVRAALGDKNFWINELVRHRERGLDLFLEMDGDHFCYTIFQACGWFFNSKLKRWEPNIKVTMPEAYKLIVGLINNTPRAAAYKEQMEERATALEYPVNSVSTPSPRKESLDQLIAGDKEGLAFYTLSAPVVGACIALTIVHMCGWSRGTGVSQGTGDSSGPNGVWSYTAPKDKGTIYSDILHYIVRDTGATHFYGELLDDLVSAMYEEQLKEGAGND